MNNILDARNKEMERNMAEKGVGFLAEAAKVEGSVQTARCGFGRCWAVSRFSFFFRSMTSSFRSLLSLYVV